MTAWRLWEGGKYDGEESKAYPRVMLNGFWNYGGDDKLAFLFR
jgi:hypothetical protein